MFYDDAFKEIIEDSPFSTTAVVSLDEGGASSLQASTKAGPLGLKGILFSGSYGEDDLSKGYTTDKTVDRQFFRVSLSSLPSGIAPKDLIKRKVVIDGKDYTIDRATGNLSGVLTLVLVKGVKKA